MLIFDFDRLAHVIRPDGRRMLALAVLLLLLAGCQPRSKDILHAVSKDNVRAIRRFLKGDPALANARDAYGIPIIYHAAGHGFLAAVKVLITNGARISDKKYGTLMDWAAWHRQAGVCQYVHEKTGQKIDAYASLAVAPEWKVYKILKRRPNIADRIGPNGYPALVWAAGRPAVMWMLIDRGADVNAALGDSRHHLVWYFASCRRPRSLKVLLDAGANPFCSNPEIFPYFPHYKTITRLLVKARKRWLAKRVRPAPREPKIEGRQ